MALRDEEYCFKMLTAASGMLTPRYRLQSQWKLILPF